MRPSLIDTDILSLFFRNDTEVATRFSAYLTKYKKLNISIITYYEVLSGLKHRDAHKKMSLFMQFVSKNKVMPLTESSVAVSADIYAELRKDGEPLDDMDLLISGIAVANNLVLVTRNKKHFQKIERLEIEDWSEKQKGDA